MDNKETLYTYIGRHIGQVRLDKADAEVERMSRQTGGVWHKDFHPYMEVIGETDDDMVNPCPLSEGYCWVTCD